MSETATFRTRITKGFRRRGGDRSLDQEAGSELVSIGRNEA
jgi:hypothetical protein